MFLYKSTAIPIVRLARAEGFETSTSVKHEAENSAEILTSAFRNRKTIS